MTEAKAGKNWLTLANGDEKTSIHTNHDGVYAVVVTTTAENSGEIVIEEIVRRISDQIVSCISAGCRKGAAASCKSIPQSFDRAQDDAQ